jgi:hypothetical protein
MAEGRKRSAKAVSHIVQELPDIEQAGEVLTQSVISKMENEAEGSSPVTTLSMNHPQEDMRMIAPEQSRVGTETPLPTTIMRPNSFVSVPSSPSSNISKTVVDTLSPSASSEAKETRYPPTSPNATRVTSMSNEPPSTRSLDVNKFEDKSSEDVAIPVNHSSMSISQGSSESPSPLTTLTSSAPSARVTSTNVPKHSYSPYLISSHAVTHVPSGESVFRTIANRISILERNTTLYMQYVEIQNRSIREAIRKLEEDVGRLAGIVSCHITDRTM